MFRVQSLLLLLLPLMIGETAIVRAQQNNVPLDRDIYTEVDRASAALNSRVHTGLKPVLESRADLSDVMGYRIDTTRYYFWYTEKLYRDHLLSVKGEDYFLAFDALFRFEFGLDFGDPTAFADTVRFHNNTRGFRVKGDLGKRFSFETMFHESQTTTPQYLFYRSIADGVISGQGRVKRDGWKRLDYGWSQAVISLSAAKWLNIQLGHGRHFVGHGYRSILLSDHAPGAPYLKFSFITTNKMLQYTTWHTKLQHGVMQSDRLPTGTPGETLFYWMRARFNHLSFSLGRFDLGLFEATTFRNIDQDGVRDLDPIELNPVIGVNTLLHGFDGEYRSMVGADLRLKVTNKAFLYGQFATDDPGQERFAYQAGLRIFDIIRKDIHLQVEYNKAEPFMYTHDPARLSYMHAGLPMAHPMGSHFDELVAIADIGYDRLRLQIKVNHGNYHLDPLLEDGTADPEANVGSDLRKPDSIQTPEKEPRVRQLTFLDTNISYLFNPKINMRATVGVARRDLPGAADAQQSTYVYAAVTTGLFNRYYDH